jgi:hypothetical protein
MVLSGGLQEAALQRNTDANDRRGAQSPCAAAITISTSAPTTEERPHANLGRSLAFYGRVAQIYGAYKATQLRAAVLSGLGRSAAEIKEDVWLPQHQVGR